MTKEPSTRPSHYIWIPDTKIRIAREQSLNGLGTHYTKRELCRRGYFMPSPEQFMRFYKALIAAEERELNVLYNGANKPLAKRDVRELYNRFVLGKHGGIWTHLNARFVHGSGFRDLDIITDERIVPDGNGFAVSYEQHPLEQCVEDYCSLVDLKFNTQGLPIRRSKLPKLQRGKNIYFWRSVEDSAAWFCADPDRVGLCLMGQPNAPLQVLACAEGTPPYKLGTKRQDRIKAA